MSDTASKNRVLVIGGTGRAGLQVVHSLLAHGMSARVLARHPGSLPLGVDYVQGSIANKANLSSALAGCSGVHISVAGGPSRRHFRTVEAEGVRLAVDAARLAGVKRISLMSGSTVCPENASYPGTAAKLEAEQAVIQSGIPYFIVRGSWLMESLPAFVRGASASIIGSVSHRFYWVSAADIAEAVTAMHRSVSSDSQTVYAYGPEALTIEQALRCYVSGCSPDAKVGRISAGMLWWLGALSGSGALRNTAGLMRYFEKVGPEPEGVLQIAAPTTLGEYVAKHRRR